MKETLTEAGFDAPRMSDLGPEIEPVQQPQSSRLARLRLYWRERKVIYRACVIGFVFSTVLAFLIPMRFESTTRLMPPEQRSGAGMALLGALTTGQMGGLGSIAADLLETQSTSAVFVAVVGSQTVRDRLIERFALKDVYGLTTMEDTRKELARNTVTTDDRRTGIVSIEVTDRSPERAAQLARAYVEELDRLIATLSTSGARRERIFLEQRLASVKKELDSATKELSEFSSKHGTIDIKEQGRAIVGAVATLQGQLVATEAELRGLEQIYSPSNVRVRSLRARIGELRRQIESLGTGEADSQNSQIRSLYPSLRNLPLLGVEYAELFRRAKVQEVVFEVLTQQHELAKVQEAKEIPTVAVLDQAQVPEKKSFPPRLLIIFMGTTLTLFSIGVWITLVENWRQLRVGDPLRALVHDVAKSLPEKLLKYAGREDYKDSSPVRRSGNHDAPPESRS